MTARQPEWRFGPRIYVGVGESSHKLGAANLTVTPNLILSPAVGPPGATVTAQGYGFPPFTQVKVYWGGTTLLATVTSDVNGTFNGSSTVTFTVPAGASSGPAQVQGAWDCVIPTSCPYSGYGAFTVE